MRCLGTCCARRRHRGERVRESLAPKRSNDASTGSVGGGSGIGAMTANALLDDAIASARQGNEAMDHFDIGQCFVLKEVLLSIRQNTQP
jgi:hypothetical protein